MQQDALLRVHALRLSGADLEESIVKLVDIVEEISGVGLHLALGVFSAIVIRDFEPVLWDLDKQVRYGSLIPQEMQAKTHV
jgi:hypothetical protein